MRTVTKLPSLTVERAAYGHAIRRAMRLGGVFSAKAPTRLILVLRLPAEADLTEYAEAIRLVLADVPSKTKFAVVAPKLDRKGNLDAGQVLAELTGPSSLLVLWPFHIRVPEDVFAAADQMLDVDALQPRHLMAAIKQVHGAVVDVETATRILQCRLSTLFAALRSGRPVFAGVERLSAICEFVPPKLEVRGSRLEDLSGYGEAKEWGIALAEDLWLWRSGRIDWADVDRGILLSGPPGTGKTMFAGALAKTCSAHLVATSVSRWQSMGHLGDMLAAMRKSFSEAEARKPCILFLDELDSLGDRQSFSGENGNYCTQVVNGLLELVDGSERLEGVVIVGATNRPDDIDPALLRAGRLDTHIRIPLPGFESRKALSRTYFGPTLTDGDLERLAVATEGFSGADFDRVSREVRRQIRKSKGSVSVDLVLSKLPPPMAIEGELRWNVAVHEAGHAVVGLHLDIGILHCVSIRKEVRRYIGQHDGLALFQMGDAGLRDRRSYLDQIAMHMGGLAAEAVVLGTIFEGAGGADGSDIHQASDLATMMEVQLGMGEGLNYVRVRTAHELDRLRRESAVIARRVEKVLLREQERAKAIVESNRSAVEAIARALCENGFLDGPDVARVLAPHSLRGGNA